MKTLVIIFSIAFYLLLSPISRAQTGWFSQASGTEAELKSVYFTNSTIGWSVGANTILTTTNGGMNWMRQEFIKGENDNYTFNSVYFTNSTTGWIAGDLYVIPPGLHFGVILKTTNAGSNWIEQRDIYPINSVSFANSTTGCALVEGCLMLITTNGGANWTLEDFFNSENEYLIFKSISFANSTTGFVLGNLYVIPGHEQYNVILKTTNMGLNWIGEYGGVTDVFWNSIHFPNSTTGFAVGSCSVLGTTDGGSNWVYLVDMGIENCYYYFKSVYFPNSTTGWVVGGYITPGGTGRIILKTTNRGLNWTEQRFPTWWNIYLNSVHFPNSATGFAVGGGGIILKTTDGGLTGLEPFKNITPVGFSLSQNCPNPFNPVTVINFDLPKQSLVKLVIYDILGREVTMLVNEQLKPGTYDVDWDASNYPSGVYFYKLSSENYSETKRMVLIK